VTQAGNTARPIARKTRDFDAELCQAASVANSGGEIRIGVLLAANTEHDPEWEAALITNCRNSNEENGHA
jgi:hypothetical protein